MRQPDAPDMGDNVNASDQSFSPEQRERVRIMQAIAQRVTADTGDAFVLKGGTALLLAYGLNRYSTDLDFDGKRLEADIARALVAGASDADLTDAELNLKKNTDTTRRYMLHYPVSQFKPLKVEVSYRQADEISEDDIHVVNGIRVYRFEKLAKLKVGAFLRRLAARDIFDIGFILNTRPEVLDDETLRAVRDKIVEVGADQLSTNISDDEILSAHDTEAIVLRLIDDVAAEMAKRNGKSR